MQYQTIKIVTQNARGLRDTSKCKQLFYHLRKLEADIIFLQETHTNKDNEGAFAKLWGKGPSYLAHGTNQAHDVAILINPKSLANDPPGIIRDEEGRFIMITLEIKGVNLMLINIYAPNTDDPIFFEQITKILDTSDNCDKVIGGDFNLTLNARLDRYQSTYNNNKSAKQVHTFLDTGFTDIFREKHPESKEFTWYRGKGCQRVAARLDMFIINDELRTRINGIYHRPGILGDPSQVVLEVRANLPLHGRGFWKMNAKQLYGKKHQEGLASVLTKAKAKHKKANSAIKWEMIKTEVTSYCQLFSWELAKCNKERYARLDETLKYLKKMLDVTGKDIFEVELDIVNA